MVASSGMMATVRAAEPALARRRVAWPHVTSPRLRGGRSVVPPASTMAAHIRDVWADNFESEMNAFREAMEKYPYVAMVGVSRS